MQNESLGFKARLLQFRSNNRSAIDLSERLTERYLSTVNELISKTLADESSTAEELDVVILFTLVPGKASIGRITIPQLHLRATTPLTEAIMKTHIVQSFNRVSSAIGYNHEPTEWVRVHVSVYKGPRGSCETKPHKLDHIDDGRGYALFSPKSSNHNCGIQALSLSIMQSLKKKSKTTPGMRELKQLERLRYNTNRKKRKRSDEDESPVDLGVISDRIKKLRAEQKTIVTKAHVSDLICKLKKRSNTIRTAVGLPLNTPLHFQDLAKIAREFYNVHVLIQTEDNVTLIDTRSENTPREAFAHLYLLKGHYYQVLAVKEETLVDAVVDECPYCGSHVLIKEHQCPDKPAPSKYTAPVTPPSPTQEVGDPVESALRALFQDKLNVIFPSAGGTGKGYCQEQIARACKERKLQHCSFTATTGAAAANMNIPGVRTLHSLLGIGIHGSNKSPAELYQYVRRKRGAVKAIQKLNLLSIDEVGRLGAKTFDNIHHLFKKIRKSEELFGGVQLILAGDFLQTTPIGEPHLRCSSVFTQFMKHTKVIITPHGHRYSSQDWFETLCNIRIGKVSPEVHAILASRTTDDPDACMKPELANHVALFSNNDQVNGYNMRRTDALDGDSKTYVASDIKDGKSIEPQALDQNKERQGPYSLTLKVGSRVMLRTNKFLSNNSKLATGSLGVVTALGTLQVTIQFDSGESRHVSYMSTVNEYKFKRSQLPLMIAFGCTVDISQGLSLERVYIDTTKMLKTSPGKFYTGVGRCMSLQGLVLYGYKLSNICVDQRTLAFNNLLQQHQPGEPLFLPSEVTEPGVEAVNAGPVDTSIKVRLTRSKQTALSKSIFFDFETCTASEKQGHQPYANGIQVFLKDEKIEEVELRGPTTSKDTFDFIMDKIATDMRVYDKEAKRKELGNKYNHAKMRASACPWTAIAYNGAGFDFHFILQHLCNSKYAERLRPSTVLKGGKIVSLRLTDMESNRAVLTTHDVCQITTCSLDAAYTDYVLPRGGIPLPWNWLRQHGALNLPKEIPLKEEDFRFKDWKFVDRTSKTFQIKDEFERWLRFGGKGAFPHIFVDRVGYHNIPKGTCVQLTLDDFPAGAHQAHAKLLVDLGVIDLDSYDFHKELDTYAMSDVDMLVDIYKKIDEIAFEVVGCSVIHFPTAASMTFYGGAKNMHRDFTLDRKDNLVELDLHRLTREENEFVRRSIKGGKTFPRIPRWQSSQYQDFVNGKLTAEQVTDYAVYLDFSSMYPAAMQKYQFPYGKHRYATKADLDHIQELCDQGRIAEMPFCILNVDYELHPHETEPVISRRTCPKGVDPATQFGAVNLPIRWDNVRRLDTLTNIDLALVVKNKGKVHSVTAGLIWEKSGHVLRDWVEITVKGKVEADKQGMMAKRSLYKLLGNAFFGSHCKRDFSSKTLFIRDRAEKEEFHKKCTWTEVLSLPNSDEIWKGECKSPFGDEWLTSRAPYLGAFVLSYSRLMFDAVANKVLEYRRDPSHPDHLRKQILYSDTDSLLVHASAVLRILSYIKDEIGYLTDECYKHFDKELDEKTLIKDPTKYRFAKVMYLLAPAPKFYTGQYIHPKSEKLTDMTRKIKGIPKSQTKKLTIQDYEHFTNGDKRVINYNGLKKRGTGLTKQQVHNGIQPFTIVNNSAHRTVNATQWSGRQVVDVADSQNIYTVPHGYAQL